MNFTKSLLLYFIKQYQHDVNFERVGFQQCRLINVLSEYLLLLYIL